MNPIRNTAVGIVLIVLLASGIAASAQSSEVYTEGHVWSLTMIRTTPGMTNDYLASLKSTIKAMDDEAIKQGLMISYKILMGSSANSEDWDILLMEEYLNLASLEGHDEQWDAIQEKVANKDAMKQIMESRTSMRTIYGDKLMREVVFKQVVSIEKREASSEK